MSVGYRAVGWNRQKLRYDACVLTACLLYLALFIGVGALRDAHVTAETLLIRGLGTLAFVLLHVILSIGPLARLDTRFLPWLYNRRHLGVCMFVVAFAHGLFSIVQFHGFGDMHPLVSVLSANRRFTSLPDFPFELLGLGALTILALMASTSHDFWLRNLSPRVWKGLHMLVYLAYGLLVAHVALGSLQSERDPLLFGLLALGAAWVVGLHLVAGWRERGAEREAQNIEAQSGDGALPSDGWVDGGSAESIPEGRARVLSVGGERVAVFRYDGKLSALSNVCRHQNGPLGEGRIIDGCITCPWHGYQYRPEDGCSPPPFTEKVETHAVRLVDGRIQVERRARAPGTRLEPARLPPDTGAPA